MTDKTNSWSQTTLQTDWQNSYGLNKDGQVKQTEKIYDQNKLDNYTPAHQVLYAKLGSTQKDDIKTPSSQRVQNFLDTVTLAVEDGDLSVQDISMIEMACHDMDKDTMLKGAEIMDKTDFHIQDILRRRLKKSSCYLMNNTLFWYADRFKKRIGYIDLKEDEIRISGKKGGLSIKQVVKVVRRSLFAMHAAFEKALHKNPNLEPEVRLNYKFIVYADTGYVKNIRFDLPKLYCKSHQDKWKPSYRAGRSASARSTHNECSGFSEKIKQIISRLKFPDVRTGVETEVTLPLVFINSSRHQ